METSPYWKKIWCTVTGHNRIITEGDIKNVLDSIRRELSVGITIFKRFTQQDFDKWRSNDNLIENTPTERLAWNISKTLNLEATMSWKIFCNFLMFECHALLEDILNTTYSEDRQNRLNEQSWLFYSSERMYLIKTWKYIMENAASENHRFNDLYLNYVGSFKFTALRKLLIQQFRILLNEITPETADCCYSLRDWANRNLQEQFEILTCIILTEEFMPLSLEEFKELFLLFKEHNFTSDPKHYEILEFLNPKELTTIRRLEVLTLVIGLNPCWQDYKVWKREADELDKLIMSVIFEGELYILLITWTTLQLTLPQKSAVEKYNAHFHKFTRAAFKENVFVLMCKITEDNLLKNCSVFSIIQKNLYDLFEHLCEKFDENGSLMNHLGVTALCTELIENEELALRFFEKEEKTKVVYRVLYELFPATFDQYSQIMLKLIKHKSLTNKVLTILNSFQHYTEQAAERFEEGVVKLLQVYSPLKCIKIQAHSEALVFVKYGNTFVRYDVAYNYFEYAEQKMRKAISKPKGPEDFHRGIELYFEIMKILLDQPEVDRNEILGILHNIALLLLKVLKQEDINSNRLMKICLEIYVILVTARNERVLDVLIVNNFIPTFTRNPKDVNCYFNKSSLNPNVILTAIDEQLKMGEYGILFAYVELVRSTPRTEHNALQMHIPSLIFLFIHLFPIHFDAMYKNIADKYRITLFCLEIMLEILQNKPDESKESDKMMYDFCFEAITNYEPTVKVFLQIFRISNLHLHTRMLREFNWDNPLTFTVIKCVKASMNVLVKIFAIHNRREKTLEGSILLRKFLDHNVKPNSMRVLIGYLDQVFDPAIPRLTCHLLKKIATDETIHVLALLELNAYQIQSIFLEKLRDPLLEEHLKVAIIELITLCVEKQNALTAAFFDLDPNVSKNYDCDSIITFMEEYLHHIEKSTDYLNSPLQTAILDLFHTLWTFRKDKLIKELKEGPNFWLTLTDPLFRSIKLSNKTYSQILNILTLELFKSKGANDKINAILDRLFNKRDNHARKWCEYIISCLVDRNPQSIANGYILLSAWKNLIVSVVLTYPQCLNTAETQRLLAETCISGLLKHFMQPIDVRVLEVCSELYLFLIKNWSNSENFIYQNTFISLTKVYRYLNKYYSYMNKKFKETMLSIVIQTMKDLKVFVSANYDLVEEYLESMGEIFEKEYLKVCKQDLNVTDQKEFSEWSLLLVFGMNLITLGFSKTHPGWFLMMKFGDKVISSLGLFTANPVLFPIAKLSVQCLIIYAENMIDEFTNMQLEPFFESTRPPKRYIHTSVLSYKNALPWHFEEWWLTYIGIVKLMSTLFDKLYLSRLHIFFIFISIHEDMFKNALTLPRVTAEETALQLTSTCLDFCLKLIGWRYEWKSYRSDVYCNIIEAIYCCINSVTCVFLRPKVLTFFAAESEGRYMRLVENIPTDPLVKIMNHLMQIITTSCLCLLKAGPSLFSLVSSPDKRMFDNDVNIIIDFHIPQLYCDTERITYGTVLCLMHFLCKTITYIHAQKFSPQKDFQEIDSSRKHYIALVCPDYAGAYTISERYSLLSSDISGLSAPWLMKLDLENVIFSLESLGSLIGVQTYVLLNSDITPQVKQYLKKELCSELTCFYEFIRKCFIDQRQYRLVDNMVYRRYLSKNLPYSNLDMREEDRSYVRKCIIEPPSSEDDDSDSSSLISLSDNEKETAENVDYDQLDPTIFFTKKDFEAINVETPAAQGKSFGLNIKLKEKVCYGEKSMDGRLFKIPIDKAVLKYPKVPEIRDGDYLLYLTHWFMHFCECKH